MENYEKTTGEQNPYWQNFYEKAWHERKNILKNYLKDGMNPIQAIKHLQKKEYKYALSINGDEISWKQKYEINDNTKLTGTPIMRRTSFRGNYTDVPFYTDVSILRMLIDIIDEQGPFDSIIELGMGFGKNLFELFYLGGPVKTKYFGGEFTQSGVETAGMLAQYEPKMNVEFFHFNHLKPEVNINAGERAFVFTCHTIEQIYLLPDSWFESVSNIAKHVTCVHFEPFGFQAMNLGEATERHKQFFLQNQWNINFMERLVQARDSKTITLDSLVTEIFYSTDPCNPTSLAVWHSDKD